MRTSAATATTLGSVFDVQDDRAEERVLRASFWRASAPSAPPGGADLVSLAAYRRERESRASRAAR
ncbi:MAG TPA: hypothetical protein VGI39_09315 [Polyangiaceae bacterium]|jgi:hypothetical protein